MRKHPDRTPGRCAACQHMTTVNPDSGVCETCTRELRRQRAQWKTSPDFALRLRDPLEPVPTGETMTRSLHRFLSRLPSHQPAA